MKKKLVVLSLALVSGFAAIGCAVSSLAWFVTKQLDNDKFKNIDGTTSSAYFAYGHGTESEPYGIKTPRQLYNLAWLQYNGNFNQDKNSDGVLDKQFYFILDESLQSTGLDMTGWVLPPIGTEEFPFLGNFNGNNVSINNLTISNKSDLNTPRGIDYDEQPEIVGLFGVVGSLGSGLSYSTSVNDLYDFTLKNTVVESKTSETLIGLAAGYVNAEMSGVKVAGSATIDVNGQVSTAKSEITSKLSDYGLVGYSTKMGTKGNYSQDLSEFFQSDNGQGQGQGDWGGSLNAQKYGRIIYDAFKKPGTGTHGLAEDTSSMSTSMSTVNTVTKTDYKIAMSTSTRTWVNGSKTYYNPYADPDFFDNPQDGTTVGGKVPGGQIVYHLKDSCYLPLKFNDDNSGTASDNTGYIVGDTSGNAGVVKVASYYPSSIVNSLSNTNTSTTGVAISDKTTTYVDSSLELLTYNFKDSVWYRIQDSHNINRTGGQTTNSYLTPYTRKTTEYLGFEKYDDSRNKLQRILENSTKVQGIHFDFKEISNSNLLSVNNNIKINGTTFNSAYQLPKGSIDFNLKRTGYINFFAGTYYSSVVYNFGFFTLNHISRTGGTINYIKKISQIYQNKYWTTTAVSHSDTNPKFFYKYSDGTFSNIVVNNVTRAATLADRDTTKGNDGLVFDVATVLEGVIGRDGNILRQEINNVMFYFEVPVNDGEYCMGMPPAPSGITSYVGAYMIYLDIGANGDTVDSDDYRAYSITTKQNGNSFPSGIDFATANAGDEGGDSFGVYIASSSQGTIVFTVNDAGTTVSVAPVSGSTQVGAYAFQGDGYNNDFTVSGLSGAPPSTAAGGIRIITIKTELISGDDYVVKIHDELKLDGTINTSTYYMGSGSAIPSQTTLAAIQTTITSLTNEKIAKFRSLVKVVTLTRTDGDGEFETEYDEANCSYSGKKINVDVTLNGTEATVGEIASGYAFYVGGVQKVQNDVLS